MRKYVFDVEIFPNMFSVMFYDGDTEEVWEFSVYEGCNQLVGLLEFIKNKQLILIGYNNYFYDNGILNALLKYENVLIGSSISRINDFLFNLSGKTIGFDNLNRQDRRTIMELRYANYFSSIDLMKVGGIMKSLKLAAINLKHHKIQDLPFPFDKALTLDEIKQVLAYNFNDVDITWKLYKELEGQIRLREYLVSTYHIPSILTESDSGICNKMIDDLYSRLTGWDIEDFKYLRTKHREIYVKDVIFPQINFISNEFNEFLDYFKELEYYHIKNLLPSDPNKKIRILEYNGLRIQCGFGGIHSEDEPGIFTNNDYDLEDADVESMYPATIINYRVIGKHVNPVLIDGYTAIRDERLEAKNSGDKIKSDGLKIVLNSFFGKYGFDGSWLKDDKAMLQVTINGQLFVMMLAERLMLAGFEVISLNTDGVVTKIPKTGDWRKLYYRICDEWQAETKYNLEYTPYDLYVRRDINNYISRTTKGKVKKKGIFNEVKQIKDGFDKPIMAIALSEYFLNGKNYNDTIMQHSDIYDFCMGQKIGKTFDAVEYVVDENTTQVQRSLRYFASGISGGQLIKVKSDEEGISKTTLLGSSKVTLFNDYYDTPWDINYQYYIDEVAKIVCQVEGEEWIDRPKLEAKLAKSHIIMDKILSQLEPKLAAGRTHTKVFDTLCDRLTKVRGEIYEIMKKLEE